MNSGWQNAGRCLQSIKAWRLGAGWAKQAESQQAYRKSSKSERSGGIKRGVWSRIREAQAACKDGCGKSVPMLLAVQAAASLG